MSTVSRTAQALQWTGLVFLILLFVVWPIPHTISVRDLLLFLVIATFGYLVWRAPPTRWWHGLAWPIGFYIALTLWIVIVALFISPETVWSLDEIRGQWLKGMFALVAGGLAAMVFVRVGWMSRGLLVLFCVLLLHALYVDVVALKGLVEAWQDPIARLGPLSLHVGILPGDPEYHYLTLLRGYEWDQVMLTEGPDKSNLLSNMLLYFLLAELLHRLTVRQRWLPVGNAALAVMFAVAFYSIHVERARNGFFEVSVVVLLFGALWLVRLRRQFGRGGLALALGALLLLPTAIGYVSFATDARWQTFWQTVPVALDTQRHTAWLDLNSPLPVLPSGEPVNRSNYMRIARLKGGAELALEHPLGVGYGRNVFGHIIKRKYGVAASHSHSGLIDMALGVGVPGALLWCAFFLSVGVVAARRYVYSHDLPSTLLLFVMTGYGVRMLFDSIVRDHMLQMFLFLAAFLAVAVTAGPLSRSSAQTPASLA
jgi:hypothetical protein